MTQKTSKMMSYDPRREGRATFCTKNVHRKKKILVKGGHFKNLEKKKRFSDNTFFMFFVVFDVFLTQNDVKCDRFMPNDIT